MHPNLEQWYEVKSVGKTKSVLPAVLERMKEGRGQGPSVELTSPHAQTGRSDGLNIAQVRPNISKGRRRDGADGGPNLRNILEKDQRARERESRIQREEVRGEETQGQRCAS